MLTSHELFGFMSPTLALGILEHAHDHNKELYRTVLASVAEARKLRPIFFGRLPREKRHAEMVAVLSRPSHEIMAGNLIHDWLMKKNRAMLCAFLDALGLPHKDGAVDDLSGPMEEEKIKGAVDKLLSQYPAEEVTVYLNAFYSMNEINWPVLENMLKTDPRLQFGA